MCRRAIAVWLFAMCAVAGCRHFSLGGGYGGSGSGGPAIYVADTGNDRIVRMDDMLGHGWTTFGTMGPDINQLSRPHAICVGPDNRIYIVDSGNDRIVRVSDLSGSDWLAMGRTGSGASQFRFPADLALDRYNRLYIADRNNDRIVETDDMTGGNWKTLGTAGTGPMQFEMPTGLFVDASEHIFIADTLDIPSNQVSNRIVRVDDITGADWAAFYGPAHTSEDGLAVPSGVFVDSNRHIYVVDSNNGRILRMDDMHGRNLKSFGSTGGAVGQFNSPGGICVDSSGRIYIADTGNDRIVRMDDMSGKNWTVFGATGSSEGHFNGPVGIFVR